MMTKVSRSQITHALAQSMREFGYPDVTDEMAGEILDAYVQDASAELPHGVIGMFLKRQLEDVSEAGLDLSLLAKG